MGIRATAYSCLVMLATVGVLAGSAAASKSRVGYRSEISGPVTGFEEPCGLGSAESTPQLRSVPGNPRRLVAVYLDRGGDGVAGARSSDGGRSWQRLPVPGATSCTGGPAFRTFAVNPYLAAGPGGQALYGNSFAGQDGALFRYGVTSHAWPWGEPWQSPIPLDPGRYAQDAAVDFEPGGVARYVWARFDQVPNPATYLPAGQRLMTATSTDRGATFGQPSVLDSPDPGEFSDNPTLESTAGASVVAVRRPTASDLAAAVSGAASLEFRVDAVRSAGGATWQRTEGIATATLAFFEHPETGTSASSGLTDFTSAPRGLLAFANPSLPVDGRGTIELTISRDAGQSWAAPITTVKVPGQATLPAVAIARDRTIGLLWTDFRNDEPGDGKWTADVWFAHSSDGGRSWERIHVDGPMDVARGEVPGVFYDGGPLGVTQDLTAMGRGFGAAYTVTPPKAGTSGTDVRFARITPARP